MQKKYNGGGGDGANGNVTDDDAAVYCWAPFFVCCYGVETQHRNTLLFSRAPTQTKYDARACVWSLRDAIHFLCRPRNRWGFSKFERGAKKKENSHVDSL